MLREAKTIVLLVLSMNVMLWSGGFIELNSFQNVYPWIPASLQDFTSYTPDGTSTTDANAYYLQTSEQVKKGILETIRDEGLTGFLTITLDFLQELPLVGGFLSMIEFVLELVWNLLFGFIQAFKNAGFPPEITIPITIILTGLQGMAILTLMLSIIAARGGAKL